jgi:hypothetical protein
MLSRRFRSGRPSHRVLAGTLVTLGTLGALAMSASPAAMAAPARVVADGATSARVVPDSATSALRVPDAATSEFVIYRGLNYGGTRTTLTGCGVHNFPYSLKSYVWFGLGQSGNTYNAKNAAGRVQTTFSGNSTVKSPSANGWKSILIVC